MAKEIREVIAVQEAAAAGDVKKLKYLQSLRGMIDYGEEADLLSPSLETINHNNTASQLIEREHEALKDFFGIGVPVIIPPTILLETQKIAEAEGFKLEIKLFSLRRLKA